MDIKIEPSWKNLLREEFEKPYFQELTSFVKSEYSSYECYPKGSQIFAAFEACPVEKVKVVILGQDPYHGPKQANGLCFSVNEGIPHPPSLINIFKEISSDLNLPYPKSGDLRRWAQQGVLLLNATLTVRKGEAGSHQGQGWEVFTDQVIKILSEHRDDLIFMLWGGYAKKKKKLILTQRHSVLECGHPSPLSANRGYWFGNQHFSKANTHLKRLQKTPIDWI